jgi:hypothetical protein
LYIVHITGTKNFSSETELEDELLAMVELHLPCLPNFLFDGTRCDVVIYSSNPLIIRQKLKNKLFTHKRQCSRLKPYQVNIYYGGEITFLKILFRIV